MRASRVVSLSVLTLGLTLGGIGAAAADTSGSGWSVTTSDGSTSAFMHSTDHSFAAGSITADSNHVAESRVVAGVDRDCREFFGKFSEFATDDAVGYKWDFKSARDRKHDDDAPCCERRCHEECHHECDEHEGHCDEHDS